jgi:hypothetical protein
MVAVAVVLAGGLFGFWQLRSASLGPAPTPEEIAKLGEERSALRDQLRVLLDEHRVLDFANAPDGNVLIGVPTGFTEEMVGRMVSGMFAEVRLRLRDIKVRHEDDVKARVLFSRQTIGHFVLEVNVEEIQAVLKPSPPDLEFGKDTIGIELPVRLAEGRGKGNVHFVWQGKGIAGAVCGDLDVSPDVSSEVAPATYEVVGQFQLAAVGDTVVARPRFPDVTLKVILRPTEETWRTLEATVAAVKDDKNGICGMAIKKLDVRALVQKIIDKGFTVKLPPKLFKEIALPAAVEQTVALPGKTVSLDARPLALRVTEHMLWYGVAIGAEAAGAAPATPATAASPPPASPSPRPSASPR